MLSQAVVLHLGVVEEIPFHPGARRRLAGFGAQLVDDAGDGHELDHVGIAHQHLVEQHIAGRVIVAVDEPGHDGHLLRIERLGSLAGERLDLGAAAHGGEPSALDRERLRLRRARIHRVDLGVEDHQIGVLRFGRRRAGQARPARAAMPAPVRPMNSLRLCGDDSAWL